MAGGWVRVRGLRDYAIGAAGFLVALAVRQMAGVWLQSHYPYMTFFCAVILTAYLAGLGPALAVALAAGVAAYFSYAPARFAIAEIPSPLLGGLVFFATAMGCALVIAALRTSRNRLDSERKRYANLAENRDLLYRELQHRVSNNIQVVAGMLRLQANGASPEVGRALAEASARISLIAKIQRDLYNQTGALSSFHAFAHDLLTKALAAAGAEHVTVRINGGDQPLHPEQATAVALVLLECFNNALEHAYADGRAGEIIVDLAQDGAHWRLTMRDDGPGPPPGFDIERGHSFGLKIARAMATQLQGGFTLERGEPGAVCQLIYPALR
jgi:two-component sensor histidine kinase